MQGSGAACNWWCCGSFPNKEGIDDENYFYIFEKIINNSFEKFKPDACIIVCGADGLSGDPLGKFNLTQESYSNCLKLVLKLTQEFSTKLLVLGMKYLSILISI